MKNETEAICEHCHATGEPKEIFDNGWWWNPHHWKAKIVLDGVTMKIFQ
mgnify:CR=1 FL=1